ncbi:MAG TPA: molybdopterin-dependent oxidoreductase [Mycobacteriales bacterium]|nr:molybdopterin-dependent oxidoreductase [Mycobacteriales bacterium]
MAHGFPVLTVGPTPVVPPEQYRLKVVAADGTTARTWTLAELKALPAQRLTTDIHCVTRWSKLDTTWEGVPVDVLLEGVPPAPFLTAEAYGDYTTNLATDDVVGGRGWVVWGYDGAPLTPEHGGPVRLLVPHLYFWKSAKWLSRLVLRERDHPGFWERAGYHHRGDPWREQRYDTD